MIVRFAPLLSLLLWAAVGTHAVRAQAPAATATLPVDDSIAAPALLRDDKGTVTVTSAPGTVILYTLDGNDPDRANGDRSAGEYLAPIQLPGGGTVKARAFSADFKKKGAVASARYEPLSGEAPRPSTLVAVTQGRQWAGYNWGKRHEEVMVAMKSQQPQVVFIGDSITHNFHKKVWDLAYGPYKAVNAGYGWDRTENVLWRLKHGEIDGAAPKVFVVMIGTNNSHLNTALEIEAGVTAICTEIHTRYPQSKTLLLGIFPRGAKPDATREKLAEVNTGLAKLDGKNGITFLDIGAVFLKPEGALTRDIMPDFLHPNRLGYALWVDAMQPTLSRLLGETPRPSIASSGFPLTDLLENMPSLVDNAGPVPAEFPKTLQIKAGEQIVAIGDSITAGGGYLRNIDAVFAAQYPNLNLPRIINVGIGGQKAEDLLKRFQKDVVDKKPALVTLSIGINDVWHRLAKPHDEAILTAYTENVSKMVDMAQTAGIKVVLLTPTIIQENPAEEGNQRLKLYVAAMKKIAAEKKCTVVDLYEMFMRELAKKPPAENGKWLTSDGVHMNPRGDALMSLGVLQALGLPLEKIKAADVAK